MSSVSYLQRPCPPLGTHLDFCCCCCLFAVASWACINPIWHHYLGLLILPVESGPNTKTLQLVNSQSPLWWLLLNSAWQLVVVPFLYWPTPPHAHDLHNKEFSRAKTQDEISDAFFVFCCHFSVTLRIFTKFTGHNQRKDLPLHCSDKLLIFLQKQIKVLSVKELNVQKWYGTSSLCGVC